MIKADLYKVYDNTKNPFVLDASFVIEKESFTFLYGPSGAGKSSVLKIIAGLEKIDKGMLNINTIDWINTELGINIPPQRRATGFVFQDYNLFPNLTAEENIRYGAKTQSDTLVKRLIIAIHLEDKLNHFPSQLSGGEKQRIALARAIASEPSILLLDEPFSSLDFTLKRSLYDTLLKLKKEFNLTVLMVSHDPLEAVELGNKIITMDAGKVTFSGDPKQVLSSQIDQIRTALGSK